MLTFTQDQETRRYVDSVVSSYLPMADENDEEENDKSDTTLWFLSDTSNYVHFDRPQLWVYMYALNTNRTYRIYGGGNLIYFFYLS